jgi:hypothetical protein
MPSFFLVGVATGEDFNFSCKYMLYARYVYSLPERLYVYVRRSGSLTDREGQSARDLRHALLPLENIADILAHAKKAGLLSAYQEHFALLMERERFIKGYPAALRHDYFARAREIALCYSLPDTPSGYIGRLVRGDSNPAGFYFWLRRVFYKTKTQDKAHFYLFGYRVFSLTIG